MDFYRWVRCEACHPRHHFVRYQGNAFNKLDRALYYFTWSVTHTNYFDAKIVFLDHFVDELLLNRIFLVRNNSFTIEVLGQRYFILLKLCSGDDHQFLADQWLHDKIWVFDWIRIKGDIVFHFNRTFDQCAGRHDVDRYLYLWHALLIALCSNHQNRGWYQCTANCAPHCESCPWEYNSWFPLKDFFSKFIKIFTGIGGNEAIVIAPKKLALAFIFRALVT